jgi:hypothetical protein
MIKNICDCVFVAVRWFIDDALAFMDDVIDEMGFRFVHEKKCEMMLTVNQLARRRLDSGLLIVVIGIIFIFRWRIMKDFGMRDEEIVDKTIPVSHMLGENTRIQVYLARLKDLQCDALLLARMIRHIYLNDGRWIAADVDLAEDIRMRRRMHIAKDIEQPDEMNILLSQEFETIVAH